MPAAAVREAAGGGPGSGRAAGPGSGSGEHGPGSTARRAVRGERAVGRFGGARIDAYVVLAEEHDVATAPRGLLDETRHILPEYMVPLDARRAVPSIPLTANNKRDVTRLPTPVVPGAAARASGAGSGPARNPANAP